MSEKNYIYNFSQYVGIPGLLIWIDQALQRLLDIVYL